MTANNKAKNEFKAVAREAAQLGARFVGVTREWFDSRKQEAERPSGYYSRRATPGGPADEDERTYGRDEHATPAAAARHGGYRGIGPRGYTRTDERIREDVCEGLCDSDEIDAADINVDVGSGTVRLSGTVPNRAMKHRAEDIAEACSGVRDIENSIRVAGVDPVGGAHAYGSGSAHSGAGFGTSSAGYGGSAGTSAPGPGPASSAGSATGTTSGFGPGSAGGATGAGGGTVTAPGAGIGGSGADPKQAR